MRWCKAKGCLFLIFKSSLLLYLLNIFFVFSVNGWLLAGGDSGKVISSLSVESFLMPEVLKGIVLFFVSLLLVCVFWAAACWALWILSGMGFEYFSRLDFFWALNLISFFLVSQLNSYLFPESRAVSGVGISPFVCFIVAATICLPSIAGVGKLAARYKRKSIYISLLCFCVVGVSFMSHAPAHLSSQKPNVIIVGFDSLRPSIIDSGLMPNLMNSLSNSILYTDAVTPMARTFPAWMSVLSGVYPVKHGGRFNLMPKELLSKDTNLISVLLKEQGYRTFYATNERRFANFDNSYGFDRLIGPRIGFNDFLMGYVGDIPIVNLLRNFEVSGWLFPYLRGNRAVDKSYLISEFSSQVVSAVREFKSEGGNFFVVHFCEPHWPYFPAEKIKGVAARVVSKYPDKMYQNYVSSLFYADAQFGALIEALKETGALQDAIVFFISDHGESFDQDAVVFDPVDEKDKVLSISGWGHGTSVAIRKQSQVLLAYQVWKNGALQTAHSNDLRAVSLLDIYPTIVDYLGIEKPKELDGLSLLKYPLPANRIFYSETGFSVPAIMQRRPDMRDAFKQGVGFYRVEPNGYISLKPEKITELLLNKELAAFRGDDMVSFGRYDKDGDQFRYLDFSHKKWFSLVNGIGNGVVIDSLTSALCRQYKDDPRLRSHPVCLSIF